MINKVASLVVGACLVCATAAAQNSELSYSFVGAGYAVGEISDQDFSGFGVFGSLALNENFFVLGSASTLESDEKFFTGLGFDEIFIQEFTGGFGFHTPISPVADFVSSIQFGYAELELGDTKEDTNAVIVDAGVRSKPTDIIELSANFNFVDVEGDSGTGYSLGGRVFAAERVSFGVGFNSSDDSDSFAFDVRKDF